MPANRKPKAWNLKPQMTAAPELWRDAVVFPFWEGIGDVRAVGAPNLYGTLQSVDSDWRSSEVGRSVFIDRSPNDPHVLLNKISPLPLGGHVSVTITFLTQDTQIGNQTLFAVRGDNDANGYAFRIETNSLFWRTYGGNNGGVSAGLSENTLHVVSAVWDEGSTIKIYRDGEFLQDTSLADGNPDGSSWSGVASFGIDRDTNPSSVQSDTDLQGNLFFAAFHHRLVGADEVKALHRDPFAMLRPTGF